MTKVLPLFGLVAMFSMPATADTFTFTTDTTIGCENINYDGHDIVIDGSTVTVDCMHSFNSLQIVNGGVMRHSLGGTVPSGESEPVGVFLAVNNDVVVESGSSIDANGHGYPATAGPGAGGGAVSIRTGGGGHGGAGGDGQNQFNPGGGTYGSHSEPTQLGSGGGTSLGGRGGGAIHIVVNGMLQIDGTITAVGGTSANRDHGAGSGGSIWLAASLLAGSGAINANGGIVANSSALSGGGGGGRIAVYYDVST